MKNDNFDELDDSHDFNDLTHLVLVAELQAVNATKQFREIPA